ncbi:cyclin-like protein [Hypoxylon trugodes]|uniref:cyclin-like protein n=1 Tax=Hypoxylon trugodes TaxID=326681 RepID=UPI00218EE0C4|nr:cyclin-like protein [Hypoxylon trugodes]KAI1390493.1 cyclin-like protein [Hypoxylon trugodes]
MATEDARYRQSSQYRLWSFAPSHLATLREKTNALAKSHIANRLRASDPTNQSPPNFLTPEEEYTLLNHFTLELLRAAPYCQLPTDIQATAAIFLRRFYVTNSVMTYPPQELIKTCLFFGCKAEGSFIRVQKIADTFPNTTGEMILAAEYILCQGIRFAFDVRHPFRALEGTVMELRSLGDFDDDRINKAHRRTREILKFSPLVTDVYFHYTPSQIMYAALAMADEELVQRMLQEAFSGQGEEAKNKIWGVIQGCKEMLEREPPEKMAKYSNDPETTKAMKALRKKLAKCRDPDRVDLVALQKARREQAAQKPKAKEDADGDGKVFGNGTLDERESKRRKVAQNGGDIFGPPL